MGIQCSGSCGREGASKLLFYRRHISGLLSSARDVAFEFGANLCFCESDDIKSRYFFKINCIANVFIIAHCDADIC